MEKKVHEYEFAVKTQTLASGKLVLMPVCRIKSRFKISSNPWERIVKIYDKYMTMELHFEPELSLQDCHEHIKGFQDQLKEIISNKIVITSITPVDQ